MGFVLLRQFALPHPLSPVADERDAQGMLAHHGALWAWLREEIKGDWRLEWRPVDEASLPLWADEQHVLYDLVLVYAKDSDAVLHRLWWGDTFPFVG